MDGRSSQLNVTRRYGSVPQFGNNRTPEFGVRTALRTVRSFLGRYKLLNLPMCNLKKFKIVLKKLSALHHSIFQNISTKNRYLKKKIKV